MTSMIETYFTDKQPNITEAFDVNKAVINALGDPDCRKILEATYVKSKRASQIKSEKNLPQTSIYRKLEQLEKIGLLKSRQYRIDGSKCFRYKCTMQKLMLKFNGHFDVRIN